MILGVLQWYHNGRFIGSSSFKERWTSVFPVFGLYVPGQSIAIDFQASQPKMSRSWAFSTVRKRLEFRSIAGPKKSLGWPVGMSQEILSWPRETFTLELTYPQDPHSNQSVTSNIRIAVVSPEEKWKPFQQWPKTLVATIVSLFNAAWPFMTMIVPWNIYRSNYKTSYCRNMYNCVIYIHFCLMLQFLLTSVILA